MDPIYYLFVVSTKYTNKKSTTGIR